MKKKTALIFYNNALKSESSQNIYLYIKIKYHYLNAFGISPFPFLINIHSRSCAAHSR